MSRLLLLMLIIATSCGRDETISAFADPSATYRLVSMDGTEIETHATLAFPEQGQVTGEGPCNSFSARQTVPYPWVEIGPIRSTRRTCPDLAAEQAYFDALGDMTLIEISGPTLILSTPEGREMVFQVEN